MPQLSLKLRFDKRLGRVTEFLVNYGDRTATAAQHDAIAQMIASELLPTATIRVFGEKGTVESDPRREPSTSPKPGRRHFRPPLTPKILVPSNGSESQGRYLVASGIVPKVKRGAEYWIGVQPSGCRDAGLWWPQNNPLELGRDGTWTLENVLLGREGPEAVHDIGSTFTIGLFEVSKEGQEAFRLFGAKDGFEIPPGCRLLEAVEVKRVRS